MSTGEGAVPPGFRGVLFDLLSGLLDSWSLWNAIAGSAEAGLRWRQEYLRITYKTGAYRPYEDLVAEAAIATSCGARAAQELEARHGELQPWPEADGILRQIAAAGIRLGVVTNCSERLGRIAASRLGVDFATIVTAERAGFYKPDPRPYLLGLGELGLEPAQCLFVAGSPWDLPGTTAVGLPTFWHNRAGLQAPPGCAGPRWEAATLAGLVIGNKAPFGRV